MSIELTTGAKGEAFFRDHLAYPFFFDDMSMRDLRLTPRKFNESIVQCNIEGDFKLYDDTVIEIKSLNGSFNNVMIEYARGQNKDRQGWYQHCKDNNIGFIVWNRYRSPADDYPAYSIQVCFPALSAYFDRNMLDPSWRKLHKSVALRQLDSYGRPDLFHNMLIDCTELINNAGCVMRIAYPLPEEQTISNVLHRPALPPWRGLCIKNILVPWK